MISKNTRRLHHCCCFVRSSIEQAGERARERATCSRSRSSANQEIGTKRRARARARETARSRRVDLSTRYDVADCVALLEESGKNCACGADDEVMSATEAHVKAAEGAPRKMVASITSTRYLRSNTAVLALSGVDMRFECSISI